MERSTRQRTAIRDVITAAGRPLSPQEIFDGVRATVPEIGIATVYRTIKLLLEAAAIESVTLPGESARFESVQAAHRHHHHFHCTSCDRVFDVDGCPGPMHNLAPQGFTIERHELTLYGVCADCAQARARPGKGKPAR